MFKRLALLVVLMVMGCQSAAPTATPKPSGVSRNRDWQPVIQSFDGFEMVKVPSGCFLMGSMEGRRDEQPVHEVCFEKAFWLDRYEVTNAQYGSAGAFQGDKRPRENVTWFEARAFCVQRGGRLPTEAEWEYAARGPENWHFPWGNYMDDSRLIFDKNNNYQTGEVGLYPLGESWVGALDMSGNVWEWTSTLYRPYPYQANDGREDPNNTTDRRVFRGGWLSYIDYGVSGHTRFQIAPDHPDWFIGIRCARDD